MSREDIELPVSKTAKFAGNCILVPPLKGHQAFTFVAFYVEGEMQPKNVE